MTITELIAQIWKKADEEGIDLESLGIFDGEDLEMYALRFMLCHLEDLDEIQDIDDIQDDDEEEELGL